MTKSTKRNLLLLLVAVLLIILVIFLPNRSQTQLVRSVVFPAVNAKIDRIEFIRFTNTFEVNLIDGNWQLGEEGFPVLKNEVATLLAKIEKSRNAEVVSDANIYEPYGLGDTQKLEIVFYEGVDLVKKLVVGKSANQINTFYGMEDDDPIVYQIALDRYDLDYPVDNLLDLKIFDFPSPQVVQLSISDKGKKSFALTRPSENLTLDNSTNVSAPTQANREWTNVAGITYQKEKVNDIVNYLAILKAKRILAPDMKYQEHQPGTGGALRSITITMESGNEMLIDIMEQRGNDYYVIVNDKKFHYLIGEVDGNRLLADIK